jgi:hypothetical protein
VLRLAGKARSVVQRARALHKGFGPLPTRSLARPTHRQRNARSAARRTQHAHDRRLYTADDRRSNRRTDGRRQRGTPPAQYLPLRPRRASRAFTRSSTLRACLSHTHGLQYTVQYTVKHTVQQTRPPSAVASCPIAGQELWISRHPTSALRLLHRGA